MPAAVIWHRARFRRSSLEMNCASMRACNPALPISLEPASKALSPAVRPLANAEAPSGDKPLPSIFSPWTGSIQCASLRAARPSSPMLLR
jgi:hypothetical protein